MPTQDKKACYKYIYRIVEKVITRTKKTQEKNNSVVSQVLYLFCVCVCFNNKLSFSCNMNYFILYLLILVSS